MGKKGGLLTSNKQIQELIDLARMQIEIADVQLTAKAVTAGLFALCYLTSVTPRDMAEQLFTGLPEEDEWEDEILPHILDYPDDYESLTGG